MTIITKKVGDSINWTCTYKDSAGTPIDLTNLVILCKARLNKTDDTPLFDLSIGNGITVTEAVNGLYTILIVDTTSYTVDLFDVDIQFTDAQGIVLSTETFQLNMIESISL